jgi:hypothetical protein
MKTEDTILLWLALFGAIAMIGIVSLVGML